MQTQNSQILHNRMTIQHAQSVMRSKFNRAIQDFEELLAKHNLDITANVHIDISYTRKDDTKREHMN